MWWKNVIGWGSIMAWHGMVWYVMKLYGMVCDEMVWYGMWWKNVIGVGSIIIMKMERCPILLPLLTLRQTFILKRLKMITNQTNILRLNFFQDEHFRSLSQKDKAAAIFLSRNFVSQSIRGMVWLCWKYFVNWDHHQFSHGGWTNIKF